MRALRDFQREDVDRIKASKLRALVASAPGTGKTPIAIRSLAETNRISLPSMIVCPASVTRNWAREIKRWAPGVKPILIESTDKPIRPHPGAVIFIISWALLDSRWNDLIKAGVKSVVADEAHFAKNPEALRTQALYQIATHCRRVLLLTGTPIVNTKEELEVLNNLIGQNPLMIRRLIEDVAPDIPPKTRSYLYIKLRDKHLEEYQKADREFENWLRREKEKLLGDGMAEIEVQRVLAAEALAKLGYLRRLLGQCKVPAAVDWISRAVRVGEPVVVFVEHQEVLRRLSKGLHKQRIRHAIIDGSTASKQRQEYIDAFQKNEYPVIIGTKAAKEGITLTAARHLLFVERFFTSADEEQAEDRIRRIGQTHPTTIWFLHAVGTVDDRLNAIVESKRQLIRTAIGAAEIVETPTGNVEALVESWNKAVDADDHQASNLGLGKPLPPLPSPSVTHGIVFYGERWNQDSALSWCKMHGYEPSKKVDMTDRFKLIVHPADIFLKNAFDTTKVCSDVRIITGTRLSRANERRVRLALRSAG
jgi:SNF2 family DNA or RNA helicase